jgi:arginase
VPPQTLDYLIFKAAVNDAACGTVRRVSYASVHIIGVSLDLGGNRRGVDMGPSAFRIAGLANG